MSVPVFPDHTRFKLRLRNARQIATVAAPAAAVNYDIGLLHDASVVVGLDGRVCVVAPESALAHASWYATAVFDADVDLRGRQSIVPGLVDAHTHPVWAGDRVHEFELKLAGATYMDIHARGGGIGFTVAHTRAADEPTLLQLLIRRLDRMLALGSTCIEAKSGYGLEADTELKMLRVLKQAQDAHPIEISATFLGAHSVPAGSTAPQATEDVVNVQIPAVVKARNLGQIYVDNIDVFMEKGVFDAEQTEKILTKGKECGMCINFHGDELNYMGSGELGGKLGARAISHLEEISPDGMRAMATNKIYAVLLPTTAYVLRIAPPPARAMIEAGVPVALGSDFNPNAHCLSMPFVMNLAAVTMKMTLNEVLVAATLNAAAALNKADMHGSIEVGKWGNFVVVDAPEWTHLVYEIGDSPIAGVYVRGDRV
ncbi:putative imidazolonepropionase [Entophlyctis luteolus]|nr:putative imidazolonepropionase [Entophlyctis luteolus]